MSKEEISLMTASDLISKFEATQKKAFYLEEEYYNIQIKLRELKELVLANKRISEKYKERLIKK